mmetsp:Transcript_1998/g.7230  ORF Transcript_1998/g.7230 Transcript_1998/m.7230 type:complete len:232 (-) Transcript_1998:118-813(-)
MRSLARAWRTHEEDTLLGELHLLEAVLVLHLVPDLLEDEVGVGHLVLLCLFSLSVLLGGGLLAGVGGLLQLLLEHCLARGNRGSDSVGGGHRRSRLLPLSLTQWLPRNSGGLERQESSGFFSPTLSHWLHDCNGRLARGRGRRLLPSALSHRLLGRRERVTCAELSELLLSHGSGAIPRIPLSLRRRCKGSVYAAARRSCSVEAQRGLGKAPACEECRPNHAGRGSIIVLS